MANWLTVREAAPLLRMSEQGVYSAVREGQLPSSAVLRIGRRIRIDATALREAANEKARDQESIGSDADGQ